MKDISGKRYGSLTVLVASHQNSEGRWIWNCLCDCGKAVLTSKNQLESGGKKSCPTCAFAGMNLKHGFRNKPIYRIWSGMKARCQQPSLRCYRDYGGRGIRVCDRWSKFENFLTDMGEQPFPGAELDRKDTNGHYCKANCRWVTKTENVRNRRNSKRWVVSGVEFPSMVAAAAHFGVSEPTIVRWCEGGKDERRGTKFGPKEGCYSYKVYEDSHMQTGV